jgi:P4 family phage/plasmid primase-like protien
MLRWKAGGESLGACLKIPFRSRDGQGTDYIRLKPDKPRLKEGKPVKYESPAGQGNRVYFPPGIEAALQDTSAALIITEGEKKALKACQEGFPCLGVTGVWSWHERRPRDTNGRGVGERTLLPDLAAIPWQDRTVYIVFDSDAEQNKEVRRAEQCLGRALKAMGAVVHIARLAGEKDAQGTPIKIGLDDFLVKHGPDALRRLLDAQPDVEVQDAIHPLEATDDPCKLARQFLLCEAHHPDRPVLVHYQEQFWTWGGMAWATVPDSRFRGQVTKFCKKQLDEENAYTVAHWTKNTEPPKVPKVTTGLVGNVLQALTGDVPVPHEAMQPTWLGSDPRPRQKDKGRGVPAYVAVRNGILDVEGLLAGEHDVLLPHTPNWFSPACLPYDFDPDAGCPRWIAFLSRNLGDDAGKATLLQQWAGYLLLADTGMQHFLMMAGEGANGKSVACAAMRAMLGDDNVSSVPLELFADKFRLAGTLGKLANIVAEVGELDKIAEGLIKAFTSGDPMEFERKFKTPFKAIPTARLMLATNNPPHFSDKSDGIWRRLLLLHFTVQIPKAEQVAGMDKVEFWRASGELPGILNWALAGLHQLRQAGRFTVPAGCQEAVEKLRTEANPARRFLLEYYTSGAGVIPTKDLYVQYRPWCEDNGHHPLADVGFGREVVRRFPAVKRNKIGPRDDRRWVYEGITPRED